MPVASMHEGSVQKHFFKVFVVFSVLLLPDSGVVEVRHTSVFGVPANVQDLAASSEQLWGQHRELQDAEKGMLL